MVAARTYDDHIPVMLPEVLEAIAPVSGETYVDATFGAGGYSRALLEAASCKVIAIDRDPNTVMLAEALARDFPGRFFFCAGCFSHMIELLAEIGVESVDGVVMDLGVSSMQLDEAERGFSFKKDGPLDMRMSADTDLVNAPQSAADLVNGMEEEELANLIYKYGEEHASRLIAKTIVKARANGPIMRTEQLAEIVRGAIGWKNSKTDAATKTFQALRIAVNDELGEVERGMEAARKLLNDNGRLVVVSFHSLEDRIAKQFFTEHSEQQGGGYSRHIPDSMIPESNKVVDFTLPKKKKIKASKDEAAANARSRSAVLRYGFKNGDATC